MSNIAEALTRVERYKRALVILLVLNLLDALATMTWLHIGIADEANPVMAAAFTYGPVVFLVAKVSVVGIASQFLWGKRQHLLSRLGVMTANLVYASIAGIHIGGAILNAM